MVVVVVFIECVWYRLIIVVSIRLMVSSSWNIVVLCLCCFGLSILVRYSGIIMLIRLLLMFCSRWFISSVVYLFDSVIIGMLVVNSRLVRNIVLCCLIRLVIMLVNSEDSMLFSSMVVIMKFSCWVVRC